MTHACELYRTLSMFLCLVFVIMLVNIEMDFIVEIDSFHSTLSINYKLDVRLSVFRMTKYGIAFV
jgi:hypothetical protein